MAEFLNTQKLPETVSGQADQVGSTGNLESNNSCPALTVAEVCRETGLKYETVRRWINLGIIDIEKRFAGEQKKYIYTTETLAQIKIVASLRELKYSLLEIKSLKDNHPLGDILANSESLEIRLDAESFGRQVYNWIQTDLISSLEQSDATITPHLTEAAVSEIAKIKKLRENQFSPNEIRRMIKDGLGYDEIEAIGDKVIKPADLIARFDITESSLRNWTALGLLEKADISKYGRIWYGLEALERCALILAFRQQGLRLHQIVDRFVDIRQRTKEPDSPQELLLAGQIVDLVPGLNKSILREYVKKGLLQPCYIDDQGWTYYSKKDVSLLRSLKRTAESGLRISEIKVMLDAGLTCEQMQDFVQNHLKVDQVAEELGASKAAVAKWARMGLLQTTRLSASTMYLWYPKTGLKQAKDVKHLIDLGVHSKEIKTALSENRLDVLVEDAKDIVSLDQLAEFFDIDSGRIGKIVESHNVPRSKYARHNKPLFDSTGLAWLEKSLSQQP